MVKQGENISLRISDEFAPEGAQIVLLDDSRLTRWRLETDLRELGFANICMAEDAASFWELLTTTTPDLILLDLVLPDADGADILRRLREKKNYADTPVIIVTSLQAGAPLIECFNMGANDYLRKPWDSAELNSRIRNHLRRRQAEKAVLRAKAEWENTFDAVPDMIAVLDLEHRCIRANKALAERFGKTPSELIGKYCHEIFHQDDDHGSPCALKQVVADGQPRHLELHNDKLDTDFWVSVSPIRDSRGAIRSVVHVVRDISVRVRLEKRLKYDATHDLMTGLFNRSTFFEHLAREMDLARRHNTTLALAIGDLDHFKNINDTMGHQTGDDVIKRFAGVMKSVTRSSDIIGRYGGEEFALIFPQSQPDGVQSCLNEILQQFKSMTFTSRNGETFNVTATFGVIILTEEETPEKMIARADNALYVGKEAGRDRVQFDD